MASLLQHGLYGAITAAVLWGFVLFFRNAAKAFRGSSTRRFCVISAVVTGLLGAFLMIMIIAGRMFSGAILFALILLVLAAALGASAGKQKEQNPEDRDPENR